MMAVFQLAAVTRLKAENPLYGSSLIDYVILHLPVFDFDVFTHSFNC